MPAINILAHATIYRNPESNRASEYVAFPSVQALPDDTLLCMCRHGSARESPDGRVRLHQSTDGGHSWRLLPPLLEPRGDLIGWWMPGGFGVAPDGGVLAWVIQAADSHTRIHQYRSSDSGLTWQAPTEIDHAPFDKIGPGGNIATLSDGTLVSGGESEGGWPGVRDAAWVSLLTRSVDGGRTWAPFVPVHCSTRPHFFDLRLAALPDNQLLAVYWTQDMEANEGCNVHLSRSDDAGRTWTPPRDAGFWGQVTDILALHSGRILAVTNHRRPPLGIRAILSDNGGAHFDAPGAVELWGLEPARTRNAPPLAPDRDVSENALEAFHHFTFGTPSIAQLRDGTIVVAFYVTEANVTYVRCCLLKEHDQV